MCYSPERILDHAVNTYSSQEQIAKEKMRTKWKQIEAHTFTIQFTPFVILFRIEWVKDILQMKPKMAMEKAKTAFNISTTVYMTCRKDFNLNDTTKTNRNKEKKSSALLFYWKSRRKKQGRIGFLLSSYKKWEFMIQFCHSVYNLQLTKLLCLWIEKMTS